MKAWVVSVIVFVLALCACQRVAPPTAISVTLTPLQACMQRAVTPAPMGSVSAKPSDKTYPKLKITTFDGRPYELSGHCGHWVVVHFWATWCGPCQQEISDLTAFIKTRNDVAVIGLAYQEIERPEMEAFLKQHTPGYPIAVINSRQPPADFDAPNALPVSYLIGPDGAVVKKFLGPITITGLKHAIDQAKPAG